MKRFILLSLSTVSLLSATVSNAVYANMLDSAAQKLSTFTLDCAHWYVGGNLGVSHLHDQQTLFSKSSVNENGPGWSVDGGYQFNSLLGAELGYTQYHDSRETRGNFTLAKTEHYTADLAATGRYPLANKLSAIAKLGAAYGYANRIFTASGFSHSAGSVSLYGGLGLDYSLTRQVDFIAQWAGARGNNYTGSSELYSLGVQFSIV